MESTEGRSPRQILDSGICAWEIAYRAVLLSGVLLAAVYGPLALKTSAFFLIGILQYHFLILSHEAQHYLIARNRKWNDAIGRWLLAYPFGQPFYSERSRHFRHHQLVGSPEDPDYGRYILDDKHPWLAMVLYYTRLVTFGKFVDYFKSTGVDSTHARSIKEFFIVALVQLVIFAGTAILFGPLFYFVFWLLPLWTVAVFLSEFREFCEHVSCAQSPARLKTFRPPAWQRFVIGPVGFVYHAEHHLFPWIPHYQLRETAMRMTQNEQVEVLTSYFNVPMKCRASDAVLMAS